MLPIERPGKIVCVGLNYRAHAEEQGRTPPEQPVLFAKWATSLIGPGEPIVLPSLSQAVDHEAELGVVIGARVRGVSAENALEAVRGYLCANDVSARDLQRREPQWTRAKGADGFCPWGPWITTADEVPDPQSLQITTHVNGELRQDSSTSDLVFGPQEIVDFIAETCTLEPGDLILTGTPSGVGMAMDPRQFLASGDVVRIEIESLGVIEHAIA